MSQKPEEAVHPPPLPSSQQHVEYPYIRTVTRNRKGNIPKLYQFSCNNVKIPIKSYFSWDRVDVSTSGLSAARNCRRMSLSDEASGALECPPLGRSGPGNHTGAGAGSGSVIVLTARVHSAIGRCVIVAAASVADLWPLGILALRRLSSHAVSVD